MRTISDEIVDVAARELATMRSVMGENAWRDCRSDARSILLAAVPYIEAGLREKLATEIEAAMPEMPESFAGHGATRAILRDGRLAAARVARGTTGEA